MSRSNNGLLELSTRLPSQLSSVIAGRSHGQLLQGSGSVGAAHGCDPPTMQTVTSPKKPELKTKTHNQPISNPRFGEQ